MVECSSGELAMSEPPLKRGFAARVNEIEPFKVVEVVSRVRALTEAGRDFLLPALQDLGFTVPCKPEGALYVYANAGRFASDSQQFCPQMLDRHGVAVTPGLDFGRHHANEHIRFSFTTAMDRLELAVERLARVLV